MNSTFFLESIMILYKANQRSSIVLQKSPILSRRIRSRVLRIGFVMMSASCFSVGICLIPKWPFAIFSRIKKCLSVICLVRQWNSGFWARFTAAVLSIWRIGARSSLSISWNNPFNQIISLAASFAATSSSFRSGRGNHCLPFASPRDYSWSKLDNNPGSRSSRLWTATKVRVAVTFENPLLLSSISYSEVDRSRNISKNPLHLCNVFVCRISKRPWEKSNAEAKSGLVPSMRNMRAPMAWR